MKVLVRRSVLVDDSAGHHGERMEFKADDGAREKHQEPWAGEKDANKTQGKTAPPPEGVPHGWDGPEGVAAGGGGGSAALCQGAAFLANLVTAASAITVAIIALDR